MRRIQSLLPFTGHCGNRDGASIFLWKHFNTSDSFCQLTKTVVDVDPVLNLLAEDPLDKVEHGVDKGGKVDVIDPFVPHRNTLLTQVDHAPQLNWIPESHMGQGEITCVHYTSESPGKKVLKTK